MGAGDEFVEHFCLEYPFTHPIINSGNRSGFCANANRGLRYVHKTLGSSAIIVNQDTVLSNRFVDIWAEGICSPIQVTLQESPPFEKWEEYEAMSPKELVYQTHLKVTGFCLFINKNVMDKIGYLDERMRAGFDDDIVCAMAQLAGFPVQTINIPIHHYVSRAGEDYQKRLGILLDMYKQKYSIPKEVKHEDCIKWILDNHTWTPEMYCE